MSKVHENITECCARLDKLAAELEAYEKRAGELRAQAQRLAAKLCTLLDLQ